MDLASVAGGLSDTLSGLSSMGGNGDGAGSANGDS